MMMTIDNDAYATNGGMLDKGNRTRRKPSPVLCCPLHISHDLTWARSRAANIGIKILTRVSLDGIVGGTETVTKIFRKCISEENLVILNILLLTEWPPL
jgi:hypothetical protein